MNKSSFKCACLALGLSTAIAAPATATPVQWSSADNGNDHWYEIVMTTSDTSWSDANSLAETSTHNGLSGHLASITSAAEQSFLNVLNAAFVSSLPQHTGNYIRAWLGGTDAATEGTWEWTTGEAFTYENWANWAQTSKPHRKDVLAGWVGGDVWKDCKDNIENCDINAYVVEYEAAPAPAPVPVPASLPLIAAGLGALTFAGRRRKKS